MALLAGKKPNEPNWGMEDEIEWGLLHTEKDGKILREKIKSLPGQYMDFYEGVYQAIRNQQPVPVSAEDGLAVIKIIEAAYKSNREKRVCTL